MGHCPNTPIPPHAVYANTGGTHDTGMHSCFLWFHAILSECVSWYNALAIVYFFFYCFIFKLHLAQFI